MAFSFLVTFAALIGLLAASGASFFAVWASGPVSGASYWADICLSPEVLVFVFFMMSDPQTAPKEQLGRIIYRAATAAVAAGLIAFERTEFGIKVAILASLTVVCALVPMIKAVTRRFEGEHLAVAVAPTPARRSLLGRLVSAGRKPVIIAAIVIAVAAPADTAALVGNHQVVNIERGLTGEHNPQ